MRHLLLVLVTLLFASTSNADDHSTPSWDGPLVENPGMGDRGYRHGEHHHIYKHWTNSNGTSCCNDYDCRMTQARWQDGSWYALVDGNWRKMSASRFVPDDGGLGPFASVCASRTGHIWCFDPPDPGI